MSRAGIWMVTGANCGIWKACVRALAAAGASVVVNYPAKPEVAEQFDAELTARGPRRAIVVAARAGISCGAGRAPRSAGRSGK